MHRITQTTRDRDINGNNTKQKIDQIIAVDNITYTTITSCQRDICAIGKQNLCIYITLQDPMFFLATLSHIPYHGSSSSCCSKSPLVGSYGEVCEKVTKNMIKFLLSDSTDITLTTDRYVNENYHNGYISLSLVLFISLIIIRL